MGTRNKERHRMELVRILMIYDSVNHDRILGQPWYTTLKRPTRSIYRDYFKSLIFANIVLVFKQPIPKYSLTNNATVESDT